MPAIPESMQRERYADECEAAGVLPEYEALLATGNPPGFAAMLALQSPPGTRNTDRAFCQGARHRMDNMPARNRDGITKIAQRAGISTDGKFYCGGLGRYDNKHAWVSSAQDVIESCKAQRCDVEGVINHKAARPQEGPPPVVPLAPQLIQEMSRKELNADPALAEKCRKSKKARGELREMVVAKYGKKRKPRT